MPHQDAMMTAADYDTRVADALREHGAKALIEAALDHHRLHGGGNSAVDALLDEVITDWMTDAGVMGWTTARREEGFVPGGDCDPAVEEKPKKKARRKT